MKFNAKQQPNKMKELILYIARKTENDPSFGAIKLNKTLFFADFISYLHSGKSITGAMYQKLTHGPAPKCLLPVRKDMIREKDAFLRKNDIYGYGAEQLIALRDPDLTIFNAIEISLVDDILARIKKMNSTQVSEMSHEFNGWQLVDMGEDIPYELILVGTEGELTKEEIDYGISLEPLAKKQIGRGENQ